MVLHTMTVRNVVCFYIVPTATANARFGEGQGHIWLDDLQCNGSDSSLHLCPHQGVGLHNCGYHEGAGVICLFGKLNI